MLRSSASAGSLGVPIVEISDHLGWRQEADRLTAAAETILADRETYGVHLDNMETGRALVEGELSRLHRFIREDGEFASAVKTSEPHSEPVDTQEKVEQPEPEAPAWMPAYEALAPGLERPHRRRPANRHPIILRQGLHGHDPAHPGIGGEPGYPGQITSAPLIQVA